MSQLTAGELMEESITTLSPETDIHTATGTLLKKKLSGAPVGDGDTCGVGISWAPEQIIWQVVAYADSWSIGAVVLVAARRELFAGSQS